MAGDPKMPMPEDLRIAIEKARQAAEAAGGVPPLEADLFGGETQDEVKPKNEKILTLEEQLALAQRHWKIKGRGNKWMGESHPDTHAPKEED